MPFGMSLGSAQLAANVRMVDSHFLENIAFADPQGAYGNVLYGNGGAVFVDRSDVEFSNTQFVGNQVANAPYSVRFFFLELDNECFVLLKLLLNVTDVGSDCCW